MFNHVIRTIHSRDINHLENVEKERTTMSNLTCKSNYQRNTKARIIQCLCTCIYNLSMLCYMCMCVYMCWKIKIWGTICTSPQAISIFKLLGSWHASWYLCLLHFSLFLLNSILLFLYACALGAVHFFIDLFASFLINYISTHLFLRVMSGRSSFITSDPYLFYSIVILLDIR